jgi:hypothetical protein
MQITLARYKDYVFYFVLFSLISLWNIPHTIAARYVCEGLLLILILTASLGWEPILKRSKLVILFTAYLFIQMLFFSSSLSEGLAGFKSEWMHFILFTIVGAGSGLYASRIKLLNPLFFAGIAFSIPLLIHLSLTLYKGIGLGVIPWNYWGISEIHGDLAYASLQASILLTVYFLVGAKTRLQYTLVTLLLLVCVASPLIAQSRGGVIFAVGSIFFTLLSYFYFKPTTTPIRSRTILVSVVVLVFLGLILKSGVAVNPDRWGGSITRAIAGLQGDANSVFCNGVEILRKDYQSKGIPITPQIESELNAIKDGDGARVMVARSGFDLIQAHPMGINGSKQAYQIAMNQFCGKAPTILISHAHNGWIDTALAIGIPGALLLLIVIINYGVQGFRLSKGSEPCNAIGLALFASAFIWVLRALLDSTLRDQMLEMQAFIFPFLLALAIGYQPKSLSAK